MPNFFVRILSFFFKLMFAVFAAVFALSLLFVALGALFLSTIKWLITGKKPMFAVIWTGMRQSPHRFWPAASRHAPHPPGIGQVVDVEAREVKADPRLS